MLSSAILRRLSGEQAFSESSSSSNRGGASNGNNHNNADSSSSSRLMPDGPGLGIGTAGARAESAMRHSFQSQGFPSPLPKMELPTEISLLDNLFLNPMIPYPKASDSTAVGNSFLHTPRDSVSPPPRGESPHPAYPYPNVNAGDESMLRGGSRGAGATGLNGERGDDGMATPRSILAGSPATHMMHGGGAGAGAGMGAETDLAASGFDFLSFLAADDGGHGANAVWEQTEPFRQEMPMLG
jgi:hypothetical protein